MGIGLPVIGDVVRGPALAVFFGLDPISEGRQLLAECFDFDGRGIAGSLFGLGHGRGRVGILRLRIGGGLEGGCLFARGGIPSWGAVLDGGGILGSGAVLDEGGVLNLKNWQGLGIADGRDGRFERICLGCDRSGS